MKSANSCSSLIPNRDSLKALLPGYANLIQANKSPILLRSGNNRFMVQLKNAELGATPVTLSELFNHPKTILFIQVWHRLVLNGQSRHVFVARHSISQEVLHA